MLSSSKLIRKIQNYDENSVPVEILRMNSQTTLKTMQKKETIASSYLYQRDSFEFAASVWQEPILSCGSHLFL